MPSRTGAKRLKPMEALFQVQPWPEQVADALLALQSDAACVVISIATPHTEYRMLARQSIREALRNLLAAHWQQSAKSIQFSSGTGEALTLISPACAAGLSVSHAPGCSLAAVHLHYAVGVDVVRIDEGWVGGGYAPPEWEQPAQDYLGPATHQQLERTAPNLRAQAFAQAWSRYEAKLKCLGQGLTEWTPPLGRALDHCTATDLVLPDRLFGALAVGTSR